MNKIIYLLVGGALVLCSPAQVWANGDNPVCTEIGELMHGDQQKCKQGDIITVNPMMAAFLCDLSKPSIAGEKTVVCHYLGKKRPQRETKKQ